MFVAAGLVSSPPAGIAVVVGGDTNNGFAGYSAAGLVSSPPAGIAVAAGMVSSPPA